MSTSLSQPQSNQSTEANTQASIEPRRPGRTAIAPSQANSARKPTKAKSIGSHKAKPAARAGSKTEKVLALLGRPQGATLQQLMKATDWQPHSVRGFLSSVVSKKLGLKIRSAKSESGGRLYKVKAKA